MHTIRTRLALVFVGLTAVAVAVVYLVVTPSLESRLREQRLHSLAQDASIYSPALARAIGSSVDEREVDREVRQAADQADARVTLLGVSRGTLGVRSYLISDSTAEVNITDLRFRLAERAATTGRPMTGTERGGSGVIGEAARPLFFNGRVARVVVVSAPLRDVTENVAIVRRRIVIAGALALLLAALGGVLVARAISRRIARLEQIARRVAAGDFTARFPADRPDELGQLATALDDMQRQLAELDTARKTFIATASHELRTPIFSLGGFVELLEEEDLDEETRRAFLGQVREQVERLQRLTTELLDLSRLEAGSLELRPERTDLGVLARAVTSEFVLALARHGSHLELRLPRRGLTAVCDPERVAQVLRILIDNALVHTPEGTDIVVAATRRAPDDDAVGSGDVSLSVRDLAGGLVGAPTERIFEPFFTADDAQGSGLGLAIARELAERMDGELGVEAEPGATTFSFRLPA
ncbi:MAG TPA: HAMP domain-containing sensor histidine kinase [Solirubrobacteraceae bacterium]